MAILYCESVGLTQSIGRCSSAEFSDPWFVMENELSKAPIPLLLTVNAPHPYYLLSCSESSYPYYPSPC